MKLNNWSGLSDFHLHRGPGCLHCQPSTFGEGSASISFTRWERLAEFFCGLRHYSHFDSATQPFILWTELNNHGNINQTLCIWSPIINLLSSMQGLNYLELFAGRGNVFSEVRAASYDGAACELEFGDHFGFPADKNPFDFLSSSGFALGAQFRKDTKPWRCEKG